MELKETVSLRERMRINLVSAMKKAGLTQVSLADRLDISKGTVNNWIRGNNSPDVDMVPRICKALGITISALYAPTYLEPVEDDCGTSLLSSEALEIAQKYDSLDRYGKNLVRLLVDEEQKRIQEERASQIQTEEFAKAIPLRLSEQPAAAGKGIYLGPECFRTIYVKESEPVHRAAYAIPVIGDSMEPTYHDGDILLVSSEPAELGDIGIFTLDGQGYVKSLGDEVLISLNPQYDPIPARDGIICNGKVIGVLDANDVIER